jgi:hypothetical protein
MQNNPFKRIDSDGKVPAHLKMELVAEIESIRNTSVIIELYIGSFINTFLQSVNVNSKKSE